MRKFYKDQCRKNRDDRFITHPFTIIVHRIIFFQQLPGNIKWFASRSSTQLQNVRLTGIFFEGLYFTKKKLYMKNFNIKNKDNKISQGRGNSLRNEVKGWVELGSPDPLKPLPTGCMREY